MLFLNKILIWTTFLTLTTTARLPTPCIHGEMEPGSASPNNPKCGVDHWCKPYEIPPPGAGSNGTKGFCEEFSPTCTPGTHERCGINGICNKRGHCEIAIPDTTVCELKYGYTCGPGSVACGKAIAMCNRCGYCVPTPESLLKPELERGLPCGWINGPFCPSGWLCGRNAICVEADEDLD